MKYDALIVGAGLSGLSCAALLAKKGLKVCVIESCYKPGGACGIFKREDNVFEQGTSMIYGFGESGFNPYRFLFNTLEEHIDVIKHEHLYAINFKSSRVIFYEDLDKYLNELILMFPDEKDGIRKFYSDMNKIYRSVIAENPSCVGPDVVKPEDGFKSFIRHPIDYMKFLSYLNKSAKNLLTKYFNGQEILNYFDKLTSTYCYATVEEAPAILAAVMFVDNHHGGSYYPAGSTMYLIGKLEKVIEENDGDMVYNTTVNKILVENNKAIGVKFNEDNVIYSDYVVYSGNVWDMYKKLLKEEIDQNKFDEIRKIEPTYSSIVLFALVRKECISESMLPIEMIVCNKNKIDEGEITVYIPSIDDKTLCDVKYHTVIAIGPTFTTWPEPEELEYKGADYNRKKELEKLRMINIIEKIIPDFGDNIVYSEISTPTTLTKYCKKYHGSVAGPKQMIGQHMLKRQLTNSDVVNLFCCGESTVMGTGAPAVVISGCSAANLILRKKHIREYSYADSTYNYVNIVSKPYKKSDKKICNDKGINDLATMADKCQFCENASCTVACSISMPIMDINRRVCVGNIVGAKKLLNSSKLTQCIECSDRLCEKNCNRSNFDKNVSIHEIIERLIDA